MKLRQAMRGQPVIALVMILGGWIALRALFWNASLLASPVSPGLIAAAPDNSEMPGQIAPVPVAAPPAPLAGAPPRLTRPEFDIPPTARPWAAFAPGRLALAGRIAARPMPVSETAPPRLPTLALLRTAGTHIAVGTAAAHQAIWMAMLRVPAPMRLAVPTPERTVAPFLQPPLNPAGPSRWSGDSWLLLRQGGNVPLASAPASSTYGASQAGGVLRYRLAPASGHRPAAYARATAALNGSDEKEAAVGLSARPFRDLPVVAMAELRATDQRSGTRLRPAVLAVTELAPFALPHRFRGEAYAQAGYVGGRGATAFADGQLRIDRGVATLGRAELRSGAGVWGGAQKGASRLDLGPSATMAMGLGGSASARVAVDWRFRVAGDAEPSSGPALTLSAGF